MLQGDCGRQLHINLKYIKGIIKNHPSTFSLKAKADFWEAGANQLRPIQTLEYVAVLEVTPVCTKVCFKNFVTQIIKLHKFLNICGRSIIQSALERFSVEQFQNK